jgi:HSP20 family molecular chaperone IbpA
MRLSSCVEVTGTCSFFWLLDAMLLSWLQKEEEDDKTGFRRVERGYGQFVRRFQLPDNVDPENIQVKIADVLLV